MCWNVRFANPDHNINGFIDVHVYLHLLVKMPFLLSQKAPTKSILHNKNETPLVNTDLAVKETDFTAKTIPKDVVEIKHDKAKKVLLHQAG